MRHKGNPNNGFECMQSVKAAKLLKRLFFSLHHIIGLCRLEASPTCLWRSHTEQIEGYHDQKCVKILPEEFCTATGMVI